MRRTMIEAELLKILCCPETHEGLQVANPALVETLNRQISAGGLKDRAGRSVQEKLDGGLVRGDGKFLYPIRENIPVMLVDEAIPLAG